MTWPFQKLFGFPRKLGWRKPIRKAQLAVESLENRCLPSVNVLTFHNDLASTGLNPNENQLTPANVKVGSFGKLYTTPVDGAVYAEPLVDTGVTIAAGPNTQPGAAGVHDVVFVATEHNSLYAIDAGAAGGAVLWQRSFLDTSNPNNNTLGASAITAVPSADLGDGNILPEIGITGTPVIDPTTNLLYVAVKTKETIGGNAHYVQRVHAINLGDGTDAAAPFLIGDTTNGNTNNTPIYVYGSGDGKVTDPYNNTGKPVVQFNAMRELQRGALNLVNNTLYIDWASHADNGPYHGWVVAWNVSKVKTSGMQMTGVFNASPNNGLAGIWQGSGRLAFEPDGNTFYFETGNGSGGAPTLDANGFPTKANYNEALVKMVADPTTGPTHQNPNGWGLKVADYFIPYNVGALDGADSDFGAGAPLLLPDSAGLPGHPHLLIAGGKEGKIYLIDRDHLGHFDPNNDNVLNAIPDGSGHNTPPKQLAGMVSTAAFFNGKIYLVSGYKSFADAYAINADGTLSTTSQTAISSFGFLPGSVAVSANGTTNGIAWVMDRNAHRIHAYDANTFATELWNSGQKAGGVDNLGTVVKFAVPAVANGKVYVGSTNSLVVYGLSPGANTVPNQPTLSATTLSGSSINLTWTDTTPPPNTATVYKIEQSTDNATFNPVTTAPAGATSIAIGGLKPLTTYYFRIRGSNGLGDSPYSNTASATTTNQAALLDFGGGFAGSTGKLTYNGSATINGTKAELTNGGSKQAGSVFSTSLVDVTKFTTEFTFQVNAGAGTADGFTFTIQGNSPKAHGPSGGGLGYGAGRTGATGGIPNSVAVKFDLHSNQGEGGNSTGLYTGGAAPTNVGSVDLTPTGLDLHSGHAFQVHMSYDGTTLSVTIRDTVTGKSAIQTYAIDIPATVGKSTAYAGFTGGTGGQTATQDILTWTFSPYAVTSPNAPSGLGAVPASDTSVNLNWTNNATNQTGFHLDRATDAGFTQNLITETLPASPNTFTDKATGLAPGSTFYYRLRAYNAAGDSGNTNVATVTIPPAPPTPTNQQIIGVTTSEIEMNWQDNAGHDADGYKILRAINHGTFTQVATLPPTSRTPPSTYEWSNANLTPGTYYEYHIIAYNVSGSNDFAGLNVTTLTLPPSNVSATPGNAVVTVSWTAPTGAVSYNVYRGIASGQEGNTPLATGVTTTSYQDTAVSNGITYYYTVTAVNANTSIDPSLPSESAPSQEVSATPSMLTPPPAAANRLLIAPNGDPPDVGEGGDVDTFTVVLSSQPTADVTVTLATDGLVSAAPTSLTFTPANWDTVQTITVSAVNDNLVELDHSGEVTFTASSADANYNGIGIAGLVIHIVDDDLPVVPDTPPPGNLQQVAHLFAHSREHAIDLVTTAYHKYLGREPDLAGLNGWVSQMLSGGLTDEQLEAGFIGSAEYIQDHGGTGPAWVKGMYTDLLGRIPSQAEVDGWVRNLQNGMAPSQVAYGFAAGGEREGQRVTADYRQFLSRDPTPEEQAGWVNAFLGGLSNEDVLAGVVGSPEYYNNPAKGDGNRAEWISRAYLDVLHRAASVDDVKGWLQFLK